MRPVALLPTTLPGLLAVGLLAAGAALAVWRRFPVSYTMAMLCIGVFAMQQGSLVLQGACALVGLPSGRPLTADCVLLDLSFIGPAFVEGQRPLTPLTYMFVHADLLHLAGNMFILLTAGPALEERIGSRNFAVIYLLAGLAAAGATLGLWQVGFFKGGEEFSPNVGASGAIFGVLTGFAVLFPRERLPMILPFMFMVFWMPAFTVLLLHLGFNLVYFFSNTNIAWWGHFAGFIVGLAVAPVLHRRIPARRAVKPLRVDVEALRPVATTNVQRSALRELEKLAEPKTPDDRALAEVWWERFVARAHCPQCASKLELRDGTLTCPRGDYEVRAVRE